MLQILILTKIKMSPSRQLVHVIIILFFLLSSGCSSLGYYAQSISGQVGILLKKKDIKSLISNPNTDLQLRNKLIEVQSILEFAHNKLSLPDNGSYQHYTDINNRFVVWNVIATPEFSMDSKEWCYLIVGCMNYRGYFRETEASRYADSLKQDGWEIYIGGVTAYSTLGWFKDPLLNTILNREDWEIARLIFHELAHQLIYVKDDTEFNEAFADSVSLIGLNYWLSSQPSEKRQKVMELIEHENEFTELALKTRELLQKLYQSDTKTSELRQRKSEIISEMKKSLMLKQSGWAEDQRFNAWVTSDINNARLSLLSTYRTLVPDFMNAYKNSGSKLGDFYAKIKELSNCPRDVRLHSLRAPGQALSCNY